ncbi:MAG: hypothetical protein M0Q91_09910 [Methanoregula sp.]|jgi:hypothetical protein|nr:hypothetical protein [Methanoregula sp.]
MVNVGNAVDNWAYNISGITGGIDYDYISAQNSSRVQKSGGGVTIRTTTPTSSSCTLHLGYNDPSLDEQFQIFFAVLSNASLESILEVATEERWLSQYDDLTITFDIQVG